MKIFFFRKRTLRFVSSFTSSSDVISLYAFSKFKLNLAGYMIFASTFEALKLYNFPLGIIHKGRLLNGVGRGVHQKEIY